MPIIDERRTELELLAEKMHVANWAGYMAGGGNAGEPTPEGAFWHAEKFLAARDLRREIRP